MAGMGSISSEQEAAQSFQEIKNREQNEEQQIHEVVEQVKEVIQEEKKEIKVNEDLLDHLKQIMSDYEAMSREIDQLTSGLQQANSKGERHDIIVKWYMNHGKEIRGQIKDLHNQFETVREDEEVEVDITEEVGKQESQLEEEVVSIVQEHQEDVEQVKKALDYGEKVVGDAGDHEILQGA